MKRQEAFIIKRKMLKIALHEHTTRSDGALSPEEMIRLFRKNGYDAVALTDHRYYNYENFAPDVQMTIIPGMEFDDTIESGHGFRCFHTVCIGTSEKNGNGFKQDERLESGKAKCQEEYQSYLDDIHAKNNLTIHCHPMWSGTPARYFEKLESNIAMEIWNSGCAMENDMDTDAAYWDELLGAGKRIWGVATDDAHNESQCCKGYVMVNAENDLDSILESLKNGAFYSSCGPEIYDFYIEDGKAVIECSPAAKIRFHSDMHSTKITRSEDGSLTRAELDLNGGWEGSYDYIRATVIDHDGRYAWTNPIFIDAQN